MLELYGPGRYEGREDPLVKVENDFLAHSEKFWYTVIVEQNGRSDLHVADRMGAWWV